MLTQTQIKKILENKENELQLLNNNLVAYTTYNGITRINLYSIDFEYHKYYGCQLLQSSLYYHEYRDEIYYFYDNKLYFDDVKNHSNDSEENLKIFVDEENKIYSLAYFLNEKLKHIYEFKTNKINSLTLEELKEMFDNVKKWNNDALIPDYFNLEKETQEKLKEKYLKHDNRKSSNNNYLWLYENYKLNIENLFLKPLYELCNDYTSKKISELNSNNISFLYTSLLTKNNVKKAESSWIKENKQKIDLCNKFYNMIELLKSKDYKTIKVQCKENKSFSYPVNDLWRALYNQKFSSYTATKKNNIDKWNDISIYDVVKITYGKNVLLEVND